jgi:hypothetical protein
VLDLVPFALPPEGVVADRDRQSALVGQPVQFLNSEEQPPAFTAAVGANTVSSITSSIALSTSPTAWR